MKPQLLIAFMLLVVPTLACTQHTLRVVDPEGRGLGGVDVHGRSASDEAWRVLAVTDDSGVVAVPNVGTESLRLASLGHETRVLRIGDLESHDPIVLRKQPLLIPGLAARSPRVACASADDPAARRLWERAAEPHRGTWDTVGLAAYGSFHGGPVSFEGRVNPPGDSGNAWVMALGGSHSVDDRILEHGYAWPFRAGLRGIWEGQDFGYWYYPRFGLFNAYHLTSRLFGELNRFVVLDHDADQVQLAFCSRDQERPYLMGVLTLRDGDIIHAIWRFSTPYPVEDAGGEATFQPNPNAAILTPAVSVYWRSRGRDEPYLQRRFLVIDEYLLEPQLQARNARRDPPPS